MISLSMSSLAAIILGKLKYIIYLNILILCVSDLGTVLKRDITNGEKRDFLNGSNSEPHSTSTKPDLNE